MSLVLTQIVFGLIIFVVVPSSFWYGSQKYAQSEAGFVVGVIPPTIVTVLLLAVSQFLLPAAWTGRLLLAEGVGLVLGLVLLGVVNRLAGDEDG